MFSCTILQQSECTYIRIYRHTYMHTNVQTYIPINSFFFPNPSTYISAYLPIHINVNTNIHTYIRTYLRTYIHTYMHTYIRVYITYIHICACMLTFTQICLLFLHTYIHTNMYAYTRRRIMGFWSAGIRPRRSSTLYPRVRLLEKRRATLPSLRHSREWVANNLRISCVSYLSAIDSPAVALTSPCSLSYVSRVHNFCDTDMRFKTLWNSCMFYLLKWRRERCNDEVLCTIRMKSHL